MAANPHLGAVAKAECEPPLGLITQAVRMLNVTTGVLCQI